MSLLNSIKQGIAKSGSSKGKILYTKDGSKVRVRFLQDIEDGLKVVMHDSFEQGINSLCAEHYGQDCPYCGDDSMRTRESYVWCIYDHDAKDVKLFMGYANQYSPLPALVGMFESYGTSLDRDYVISQTGQQTNKTFSVVPMDKTKFKNAKAKPLSEKAMIKLLKEAFPIEDLEDEEEEEVKPKGKKKQQSSKNSSKSKGRKKYEEEEEDEFEDEEFDEFEDEDDEDESEYEGMSAKELYKECKERGLDVKPKKKAEYYIEILEEDDAADEDEEDDWEDEDDDEEGDW